MDRPPERSQRSTYARAIGRLALISAAVALYSEGRIGGTIGLFLIWIAIPIAFGCWSIVHALRATRRVKDPIQLLLSASVVALTVPALWILIRITLGAWPIYQPHWLLLASGLPSGILRYRAWSTPR